MKCAYCKENIWAYLEGSLSQEMAQEIEKHLLVCADCKEEADLIKNMMQALHSLPSVELPQGYHAELMQKIEKEANTTNVVAFPKNRKTNWKNMGLVAAALLVVAVAGGIQGIQRMKQPQDAIIAQIQEPIQPETETINDTTVQPKQQNETVNIQISEKIIQEPEQAVIPKQQERETEQPKQQVVQSKPKTTAMQQNQSTQENAQKQQVQQNTTQPQTFTVEQTKQTPQMADMTSSGEQLLQSRANTQQPETAYATLSVEDTQKAVESLKIMAENLSLEVSTKENQVTVSMQYQQMADFYEDLKDLGDLTMETEISENMEEETVVLVQITCEQK